MFVQKCLKLSKNKTGLNNQGNLIYRVLIAASSPKTTLKHPNLF